MVSNIKIKNMTTLLTEAMVKRTALAKKLCRLDHAITEQQQAINTALISHFEEQEHNQDDSTEEDEVYECRLRKRKTKNIEKGSNIKATRRMEIRILTHRKKEKEYRSRKRSQRSRTHCKGVRDYGVNINTAADQDVPDMDESESDYADWIENYSIEISKLLENW